MASKEDTGAAEHVRYVLYTKVLIPVACLLNIYNWNLLVVYCLPVSIVELYNFHTIGL